VIAVWDSSTVLANLVERLGDQTTDDRVLRRETGDLSDLFLALDLTCVLEQAGVDRLDGSVDAALERGRGCTCGNVAKTLLDHGLSQDGRGGRAVTGDVVGLGGDLLGELRAEVLVRVVELHLTGDGHAVVGDGRSAPLLVDDDVATLGAERHLDRVGELVHASLERLARRVIELQRLGHELP